MKWFEKKKAYILKWLQNNNNCFFALVIAVIICVILSYFLYLNWKLISNPKKYLTHVDRALEIRSKRAEKPLKDFNDSIFKRIEFKGVIFKVKGSRENNMQLQWVGIKLVGNIYNPYNLPLKIPRLYDLNNSAESKIYWHSTKDCVMDATYYGDTIMKKYGEDFYRIRFSSKKSGKLCDKYYLSTEFDYFWTIKDLEPIIDSLEKAGNDL